LRVPDDISVIGFDDIEVASQIVPALTTIAAPVEDIAKYACTMLMTMLRGEQLEFRHIVLDAHLVVRETCSTLSQR
jgi:DNA-binding LacI/PurR family transcriptional regulator